MTLVSSYEQNFRSVVDRAQDMLFCIDFETDQPCSKLFDILDLHIVTKH
jgi:hypothetical protein